MSIEKDLSQTGSVFLDTAPIIYYIEGHDAYGPIMKQITQYLYRNGVFTSTSVITIAEVLPKPVSQNQSGLIEKFLGFLKDGTKINVLEISWEIAELAGRLRGKYSSLKTIDSIQIATAFNSRAEIFITNDIKLKQISELKVIVLKDYLN